MKSEWKKVTLGDLISVSQGYTFKPEYQGVQGEKWQYFKVADIGLSSNKKYLITALNSISEEIKQFLKIKEFPAGSIAFPRVGAALLNNNKKILFQDSIVDDNTIVITPHTSTINNEFLYYWFLTKQLKDFCNDGPVPVISSKNIKSSKILLPPISEQEKIAKTLSIWDSAIEKTEKLISEKEKLYKGHLNYFYDENENCIKLSEFAKEIAQRNKNKEVTQVLSVTNKNGFVPPEQQFGKKIASEDLSNYKIIEKRQFAYNPSRINVGSIARLDEFDSAVLSPMYTVFEINTNLINSDYFLHWLSSKYAIHQIKLCAQGGVREIVGFEDFQKMRIKSLSLKEQEKIADFLNIEKSEISLLKKQLEQYKLQKQGLMQKLLTGEWRIK